MASQGGTTSSTNSGGTSAVPMQGGATGPASSGGATACNSRKASQSEPKARALTGELPDLTTSSGGVPTKADTGRDRRRETTHIASFKGTRMALDAGQAYTIIFVIGLIQPVEGTYGAHHAYPEGDQAQGGAPDHRTQGNSGSGGAQGLRQPEGTDHELGNLSSGGALASRDEMDPPHGGPMGGQGHTAHTSSTTQRKRTIVIRQGLEATEVKKQCYAMKRAARCAWLRGQRMTVKWRIRRQPRKATTNLKGSGEPNKRPTWGGVRGSPAA